MNQTIRFSVSFESRLRLNFNKYLFKWNKQLRSHSFCKRFFFFLKLAVNTSVSWFNQNRYVAAINK